MGENEALLKRVKEQECFEGCSGGRFEAVNLVCFTFGYRRLRLEGQPQKPQPSLRPSLSIFAIRRPTTTWRGREEQRRVVTFQSFKSTFLIFSFQAIPCFAILRDSICLIFLSICIRCQQAVSIHKWHQTKRLRCCDLNCLLQRYICFTGI